MMNAQVARGWNEDMLAAGGRHLYPAAATKTLLTLPYGRYLSSECRVAEKGTHSASFD
jgi:hypothetical protein